MRALWAAVLIITASGCHWLLAYEDPPQPHTPDTATPPDASIPKDLRVDDLSTERADARPESDSLAPPPHPCDPAPSADTVALYTFEETPASAQLVNAVPSTEDLSGQLLGDRWSRAPGPDGCGQALAFSPDSISSGDYGVLPVHPAWRLPQGSVAFWLRVDGFPTDEHMAGLLSRDAEHQLEAGHLTFSLHPGGSLILRHQERQSGVIYACTAPLDLSRWYHVGLNFGPGGLELFVDGHRAEVPGDLDLELHVIPCADSLTHWTLGIDGNDNPWVIGASAVSSEDGRATPVRGHFHGALDHLQISASRRDFSVFAR